jgi:hypothetical protein
VHEKYSDVCDASTIVVTVELHDDPSMYYFESDNYDLKYMGLNSKPGGSSMASPTSANFMTLMAVYRPINVS